jgi:DNA-directed RNA polymerase specialized sigma24 family protein
VTATRPLPFYPWLRRLAWEHLLEVHQRHIAARKRSVAREEGWVPGLPDDSARELAARRVAPGTSPSHRLLQEESRKRVRDALVQMAEGDREVLVLRYLERQLWADVEQTLSKARELTNGKEKSQTNR